MRILFVTPPMIQMNGPYPATPYLTSFFRQQGHIVDQCDMGIELLSVLFSKEGLYGIREEIHKNKKSKSSPTVEFFLEAFQDYALSIDPVMRFLRGQDPSLAVRLASRLLVPEGPRFLPLHQHGAQIQMLFGTMGIQDQAKHIASLYLNDLADVVRDSVDFDFAFAKYAESLASSAASFDHLENKLNKPLHLIDTYLHKLWIDKIERFQPEVVGLTLPFPGTVYGALRLAQFTKQWSPPVKVVVGGGFVNTELRSLSDARFFKYIDAAIYDDGEQPFMNLLNYYSGAATEKSLLRVRLLNQVKEVEFYNSPSEPLLKFSETSTPTYEGLPLQKYISLLEMPNPMNRMWSDFRWNKLILAHGCYWKRCTFCDVNLDYIGRYEPQKAGVIVDQIEKIVKENGTTGFHFVDEAAPPALLKQVSKEIIRRGLKISWWGNLRFDTQFDLELCQLMSDAGCVAVTGGLEVASPRLLKLINKGITVEQVARVTRAFAKSGIFVHAYLMYGFPTQTVQETVDSLEIVRQLFAQGCLQSGFWHRFLATVHSPVCRDPEKFGVKLKPPPVPPEGMFSIYSVDYEEENAADHEALGEGLKIALYNYMHGIGLQEDTRAWFPMKVPKPQVKKSWLKNILKESSV